MLDWAACIAATWFSISRFQTGIFFCCPPVPANLTVQYQKAEQAYRQATTPEEELACLEQMLREIPKHKGTDKLQADLKHKISRAREELTHRKTAPGKPSGRIPRQGAGRAVILGGPNSGKSSLLAALTRATPEIGDYPFTTRELLPGMMPWQDLQVQLMDSPPVTADICDAATVGIVRGAEVVILMLDLGSDEGADDLQAVLNQFAGKTRLGSESRIDETDIGTTYTATLLVLNKFDLEDAAARLELFDELLPDRFPRFQVSCKDGWGLDELRQAVFEACDCVRVYTRQPNRKQADMEKPFALKRGSTIQDLAELIHRDIAKTLKSARVWKAHAHDAISVKPDHELSDCDIVELIRG